MIRLAILRRRDLSAAEKITLSAMRAVGAKSGFFYMSLGSLAESLGFDRSTVQRIVRALQAKGLLSREETGGRGPRSTNVFSLLPPEARSGEEQAALEGGPQLAALDGGVVHEEAPQLAALKCGMLHRQVPQLAAQGVEEERIPQGGAEEATCASPALRAAPTETATTQRQVLLPLSSDPPTAGESLGLDAVLSILAPAGPSDKLRAVVINALADAQAAGVSPQEVAAGLPRAGPGSPWERIARAADLVLRERLEKARLEAAAQSPKPAPGEPASARLPALAEAIQGLSVREIHLRDRPDFKARVISARADGIVVESPNYRHDCTKPCRVTLRSERDLSRWCFGAAEGALVEGRP